MRPYYIALKDFTSVSTIFLKTPRRAGSLLSLHFLSGPLEPTRLPLHHT
jgi:hypothetical protein